MKLPKTKTQKTPITRPIPSRNDLREKRMKEQFKGIRQMLITIEKTVLALGRMEEHEVELMLTTHRLSPLGREVFTAFLEQSDVVIWEGEPGHRYLVKHPEYLVEEDELTQPRTIVEVE